MLQNFLFALILSASFFNSTLLCHLFVFVLHSAWLSAALFILFTADTYERSRRAGVFIRLSLFLFVFMFLLLEYYLFAFSCMCTPQCLDSTWIVHKGGGI